MKIIILLLSFFLFLTAPEIAFAQNNTEEKLITVDIDKQMLYAWENGRVVNQSLVSTGLIRTPTVKGSFQIYRKIPSQAMRGYSLVNGWYYHPNVPSVMYFYKAYAIHGAYWHNNFGQRMSNGCVNLPLPFAQWLFNWAPNGTRVEIS
ncbi:L,D-transpeptidase [Candidatus Microgenomates bacterium]|nr:L,D-transpeptidase [Candidatus Microgenomates bacterium]